MISMMQTIRRVTVAANFAALIIIAAALLALGGCSAGSSFPDYRPAGERGCAQ